MIAYGKGLRTKWQGHKSSVLYGNASGHGGWWCWRTLSDAVTFHLSCKAHSPTFLSLHLRHNSFSNPSVALSTSQLILQPFHCFTYVTAHSPTLPLLHLRHNSFSNPSVALSTSQLILQAFRCFTYVTAQSPILPLLHLRHNSFSNPSVGELSSNLTVTSPTVRHNSFSNPSIALPTSQPILQTFRCFTYVTVHSSTLLSLLLHHKLFT